MAGGSPETQYEAWENLDGAGGAKGDSAGNYRIMKEMPQGQETRNKEK